MSNDNVKHLITRKSVGMDQLEQFDSAGVPGPFTTPEMAFAKVKELVKFIKQRRWEEEFPEPARYRAALEPIMKVTGELDEGAAVEKILSRLERRTEALRRSLNWLASYPGGNAEGAYNQAREALSDDS